MSEGVCCDVLIEQLPSILNGIVIATPQDQIIDTKGIKPYYYHQNSLNNREIDPKWDSQRIYYFVRALQFGPREVESRAYLKIGDYKFYLSIK